MVILWLAFWQLESAGRGVSGVSWQRLRGRVWSESIIGKYLVSVKYFLLADSVYYFEGKKYSQA